jgi:hypothetical protein
MSPAKLVEDPETGSQLGMSARASVVATYIHLAVSRIALLATLRMTE